MHKLGELRDKLMEELEEYSKKDEMSISCLDIIDKLSHSIKSIDTIMAMEEAGYSNEHSYARGRGSYARRDSMGRYSGRDRYDDRGYSRADSREELSMDLKDLKMETKDPELARMIGEWIKQVER